MPMTTFVLIVSFMTPYGFTESSHYDQFETEAACLSVGNAKKEKLPGTFTIMGIEYPMPLLTFECKRGRVMNDAVGWSAQ